MVEVTVRRGRELERADGTIELGAAAAAAPAVTRSPPLWVTPPLLVITTLLIGFWFILESGRARTARALMLVRARDMARARGRVVVQWRRRKGATEQTEE